MKLERNLFKKTMATEVIDFQRDGFGAKLEDAIRALRDNSAYRDDSTEVKALNALLKDRFGLDIQIRFKHDGNGAAYILPFYMSLNHPFVDQDMFDFLKQFEGTKDLNNFLAGGISKHTNVGVSEINLATARISGGFTKIPAAIELSIPMLRTKIGDGPMAALVLHEVGHFFTYCEFVQTVCTFNAGLQIVTSDLFLKASDKQREVFIQQFLPNSENDEMFEQALTNPDAKARAFVFTREILPNRSSVLGNRHYDDASCEAAADQFASRFGFGRDLIEWHYDDHTRALSTVGRIRFNMAAVGYIASVAVVAALPLFAAPLAGLAFYSAMTDGYGRIIGESSRPYGYDTIIVRYKRIREQIVASLKEGDLDKESAQKAIADCEEIEKITKKVWDQENFSDKIANFIFKKNRDEKRSVAYQRLFEELSNSDLFIKATQLKHL